MTNSNSARWPRRKVVYSATEEGSTARLFCCGRDTAEVETKKRPKALLVEAGIMTKHVSGRKKKTKSDSDEESARQEAHDNSKRSKHWHEPEKVQESFQQMICRGSVGRLIQRYKLTGFRQSEGQPRDRLGLEAHGSKRYLETNLEGCGVVGRSRDHGSRISHRPRATP